MRLLRLPPTIFRDDKAEPTKFPKKPLNWEEDMQLYSKFLDRKVRSQFWLIFVKYLGTFLLYHTKEFYTPVLMLSSRGHVDGHVRR